MQKSIMWRIRVIFWTRKALGQTALKVYAILVLVGIESTLISVGHVINNLESAAIGPRSAFWFMEAALVRTETINLVIILALTALALFVVKDFARQSLSKNHLVKVRS